MFTPAPQTNTDILIIRSLEMIQDSQDTEACKQLFVVGVFFSSNPQCAAYSCGKAAVILVEPSRRFKKSSSTAEAPLERGQNSLGLSHGSPGEFVFIFA